MGLNNPEGEPLDENFVSFRLLEPLLEAMALLKKALSTDLPHQTGLL